LIRKFRAQHAWIQHCIFWGIFKQASCRDLARLVGPAGGRGGGIIKKSIIPNKFFCFNILKFVFCDNFFTTKFHLFCQFRVIQLFVWSNFIDYYYFFFCSWLLLLLLLIVFFYVNLNNYKLFCICKMLDNGFLFSIIRPIKPKFLNNTSRPFVISFFVRAYKFPIEFNPPLFINSLKFLYYQHSRVDPSSFSL